MSLKYFKAGVRFYRGINIGKTEYVVVEISTKDLLEFRSQVVIQ